jgi:hypothetical protein
VLRFAVLRFAVLRFAVERFAVDRFFADERFAVPRLAVVRLALPRFAVVRFALLRFAVPRFAVERLRVPDARRCPSPSSSSSLPISFVAAPTAAGMATPSAAPTTTFLDVDIPSSSLAMGHSFVTSRR